MANAKRFGEATTGGKTSTIKLPPPLPIWLCKCLWDSTSVILRVPAKNELDAWDRAWKKISKTEGGDSCKKVIVLRSL